MPAGTTPPPQTDDGRSDSDDRVGDVQASMPPAQAHRTEATKHPTPHKSSTIVVASSSALLAAALTLTGGHLLGAWDGGDSPAPSGANAAAAAPATTHSTVELAELVSPAVADVTVSPDGRASASGRTATGSAVVVRSDGYLLTNAHVVAPAGSVTVRLADGTSHDAEVVGADEASDLAVLRIDARDLPAPEFADEQPQVGESTLALGSPFGLEGTVTSGIVSALDRSLSGPSSTLTGLVQTDAAINPGNSGGALVDEQGRVIGINTAIYSRSGANDGVGFAVPSTTARDVADQLIETGEVTWASLGVMGRDLDRTVADAYELATDRGALIAEVVEGSAADGAGLEPGDIVVAVDGEQVASMADLAAAIRDREPSEEVVIELLRDGRRQEKTATLDAD